MPYSTQEGGTPKCARYGAVGATLPSVVSSPVSWPADDTAQNEKQTLTVTGSPTGGTFTVTYGGQTTAALDYDATADAVETALEALSTIGNGNVRVTGSAGGPWLCEFLHDLGLQDLSAMTTDASLLTGGTDPDVTVAETQAGSAGGGTWTEFAADGDENIQIEFEKVSRQVREYGSPRPNRKHNVRGALKSITLKLTQSGLAAMRQVFPSLADNGDDTMDLQSVGAAASYIAIAVETDLGVWEAYKCAPTEDSAIELHSDDITEPEVVFETYSNDDNEVGLLHRFTA